MSGGLDVNGYPTDGTLEKNRTWPLQDFKGLLTFVGELWHNIEYWKISGREVEAHTGGWSGNESLIMALEKNRMFWSCCWQSSKRDGYYKFELPVTLS